MLIAYILPADSDKDALATNSSWRFIFGLPILTYTLIVILLAFWLPYDSPKFHIQRGERNEALKSIHKIYETQGDQRQAQRIYNHLKTTSAD
mmetsp:Transcript_11867/g.15100  ORF Transcript_11867/g.15100 Transcript_11867/m.15100 type:complete len:92 (+) Transcript_11867:643-918(+)